MFKTKANLADSVMRLTTELDRRQLVIHDRDNEITALKQELDSIKGQDKFTRALYLHELRILYKDAKENYDLKLALDLLDKIRELSK